MGPVDPAALLPPRLPAARPASPGHKRSGEKREFLPQTKRQKEGIFAANEAAKEGILAANEAAKRGAGPGACAGHRSGGAAACTGTGPPAWSAASPINYNGYNCHNGYNCYNCYNGYNCNRF